MYKALFPCLLVAVLSIGCPSKTDTGAKDTDTHDTDDTEETDTTDTDDTNPGDCPLNSAYPCSCNVQACDDGSQCTIFNEGDTRGLCLALCDGKSCPSTDFPATSQCAIQAKGSDDMYCALICTGNEQCPSDQECISLGAASACYPRP